MSEESLREIIGIAKKSKWNQIKKYIKFIIRNTLNSDAGYSLSAVGVLVNGKRKPVYDQNITTNEEINKIDKLKDFNHLILYQATLFANNHINVSKKNGTIIVQAKYYGPHLNNNQIFDFSVNQDALNDPFFTTGNGKKIDCSEMLEILNKTREPKSIKLKEDSTKKLKKVEVIGKELVEATIFEKLTNKKAIWNGSETISFQKWKGKTKNKYHSETGKPFYYNGKPTKNFSLYLKSFEIMHKNPKKKIEKKSSDQKKNEKLLSEQHIFEIITGKKAIWNRSETQNFIKWKGKTKNKYHSETGKIFYYNGKPTKNFSLYLKTLVKNNEIIHKNPKKKIEKKSSDQKKDEKLLSEQHIFEIITGKKAIWNRSETQNFIKWKEKIHKKYNKDTGKNPYYKQKGTKNFIDYLKKTFKGSLPN